MNSISALKERIRRVTLRHGIRDRVDVRRKLRAMFSRHVLSHVYPRYSARELKPALEELGFRPGRVVYVHCAWESFERFDGQPLDLIQAMRDLLGPHGTLAMPSYPIRNDPSMVFDVRRTATRAGLVAELFRRTPGGRRSINFQHSAYAIGPMAEYLTKDHHLSETAWDEMSPHYRMRTLDSSVVCLGLPASFGYGVSLHCAEAVLRRDVPYFAKVFGAAITYRHVDHEGLPGTHTNLQRIGRWHPTGIDAYLDRARAVSARVSDLRAHAIEAPYIIDTAIALGRRGVTCYSDPRPDPDLFRPVGERPLV